MPSIFCRVMSPESTLLINRRKQIIDIYSLCIYIITLNHDHDYMLPSVQVRVILCQDGISSAVIFQRLVVVSEASAVLLAIGIGGDVSTFTENEGERERLREILRFNAGLPHAFVQFISVHDTSRRALAFDVVYRMRAADHEEARVILDRFAQVDLKVCIILKHNKIYTNEQHLLDNVHQCIDALDLTLDNVHHNAGCLGKGRLCHFEHTKRNWDHEYNNIWPCNKQQHNYNNCCCHSGVWGFACCSCFGCILHPQEKESECSSLLYVCCCDGSRIYYSSFVLAYTELVVASFVCLGERKWIWGLLHYSITLHTQ
jgi:hypothetical protein